jgi:hypothetical protein
MTKLPINEFAPNDPATSASAASLMLADLAIYHSTDDAQVAMLEREWPAIITAENDRFCEALADRRAREWLASLPAAGKVRAGKRGRAAK